MRSSTAPAPSSRNVLCGRATQSGVATPAERTTDFGGRLVPGHPARGGRGADVGDAGEVEDRPERAVLSRRPVQRDEDGVRGDAARPGQQLGVGVADLGVDAGAGELLPHLGARTRG
jgi:hypothetical protein